MKTQLKQTRPSLRHLAAAVMFACAAGSAPVWSSPSASQAGGNTAALNFVGAEIESVIRAVGHYTNVNFVIDPRVKGTITLQSEKSLTKAQAFSLLASALRMQGYAVVMGDGYAKIVPEADAKLQAGLPKTKTPINGNQIVTQLYRLNYESAANMVTVLKPLISANNAINANPGNNTLVITDYLDNLRRLGNIIAALDAPSASELEVVQIRNAVASDIAVMANKLLEQSTPAAGTPTDGRTVVLADVRQNAVVIRAPSVARANLAKSLIEKLDRPTANPGNVHVVYLKNADAIKLAQTLRAVFTGQDATGSNSTTPTTPAPATTGSTTTPTTGTTATTSTTGTTSTSATMSGSTSSSTQQASGLASGFIQADSTTNTLIITASEPVYRNLRAVIDQLDVRRAQVYIESLIAEVSAEKAAEFGVQWAGLSGDSNSSYRVGGATSFSTNGNNLYNLYTGKGTVAPGGGLSLGVFRQINGELGLGAVARVLANDTNSNILSTPNLITLDNEEARIIVGQNVPFITGQYTTTASSTSTVSPFQTIERKDVGLSLRVRPQVSEGGTVRMSIYQETSSVEDSTNAAGIITKKRAIETNVLAEDGQIIVLGGLIEDTVKDGAEKVTGLGDIPVLGNLFKYQTRSRKKTNLMVFLRPTVIRTADQSVSIVADRYDYMRNAQIAVQPEQKLTLPTIGAPVLPALENGKPVENGMLLRKATSVNVAEKPAQQSAGGKSSPAAAPEAPAP
ncbi:MAG: gspD [Burkholderiaceae bacterium]|nr:gspD [Burkholderiaceae bacterium]